MSDAGKDERPRPCIAHLAECNNFLRESVLVNVGMVRVDEPAEPTPRGRGGFHALAEGELPRLYRVARRLVGEEAEDAVQDALLKAYRGYGQLQDDAAAPAWLTAILVNCCRDRARARARRPEVVELNEVEEFSLFRKIADEDPFPYSDSLHLDFLQQFGAEDVRTVLASLPERYRVPLVLVYCEGYHVKEVAFFLDVPLGTMLARLHRGRKLFERRLWEYAQEYGLLKEGARR
jgi:RNA polymerase sigma-70 factor, ECF subfamily